MKVLRVVAAFDAKFGGPSNSASNSAIATAGEGVQTTVVFTRRDASRAKDEPAVRALSEANIKWRCFALNQRYPGFCQAMCVSTSLVRWLWHHVGAYDVVHIHSPWGLHCLAAVTAAKWHGRPIVLTPHECLTRFDLSHARSPVLRALKHVLLPFYRWAFDTVVFSSALERRDSPGAWSEQRAVVIHHPVQVPNPRLARHIHRRDGEPFRVGFLGRLHPKKNIEQLIAALTLLPSQVSLLIAGDGDPVYREKLQAIGKAVIPGDRVTWCGFLTGAKKEDFLREIDLLAMPSQYECFGMVAAEAMAVGTPVLVSPETGVAETATESGAGVVVKPTGATVAAAIRGLVDNPPTHARMSQECIGAARRAFSMEAHGAALVLVYEKLGMPEVAEQVVCRAS